MSIKNAGAERLREHGWKGTN